MEIEWNVIVERLSYHRQRLKLSKQEVINYITQKYDTVFWKLTDEQIVELGKFMASCQTADEFNCNVDKINVN